MWEYGIALNLKYRLNNTKNINLGCNHLTFYCACQVVRHRVGVEVRIGDDIGLELKYYLTKTQHPIM